MTAVQQRSFASEAKARRYAAERYEGAAGRNWYTADPSLQWLMRRHLGEEGLAWATPHLEALGALMGGPVAHRAEQTDKHPPALERYDRWGHDVSRVVMPESFEATRRDLLAMGFNSDAFRERAEQGGASPAALSAAWLYLLNQAEIAMACALTTGEPMVLGLAEDYAPPDILTRVK